MDKKIKTIILIILAIIIIVTTIFIICNKSQIIKRLIIQKNKSKNINKTVTEPKIENNKNRYEKLKDYITVLFYEYTIINCKVPVHKDYDINKQDKKEFEKNYTNIENLVKNINEMILSYDKTYSQYKELKEFIIKYRIIYEFNIDDDDESVFSSSIKIFRDKQNEIINSSNNDPEYEYITKIYKFIGARRIINKYL